VYDLFFKSSLSPSNAWYWVARGLPGQTNYYLVNLPVDGGFFILGTTNFTDTNGLTAAYRGLVGGTDTLTNDFDHDGLSDAWEINFFGDLSQSPFADYDGDGISNYGSYTNAHFGDPNKIQFLLNFTAERTNSSAAFANLIIRAGNPAYFAVLVNNSNRAAANWQLFNSTNVPVNLNAGDGRYDVQIGLRGRAIGAEETWLSARLILDTVAPVVAVTNPASSSVVSWPLIQIQGWANEPLGRVSFDITNSTGLHTNLTGYVTGQFADTNLLDFTTNYFQCYDLPLAEGTNRVTVRVTDLAGNTTTTNLTLKFDYSTEANPPVLTLLWPVSGTQIAGDTFTVQARVDNPTATVEASIVDNSGNTNSVRAIVERNGLIWAKNLPLAPGTNTLILTATSAAGNVGATSVSIVHSSVTVALNPLSTNQLNKSSLNLTGTVSDSSAGVFVNGVQASVSGSGSWAATNVPASPNGTAVVDIEVYEPGSGPPSGTPIGSARIDQPQPARVVLMSYSGTQKEGKHYLEPCHQLVIDEIRQGGDDVAWSYDQGGFYREWYGGDVENPPYDITQPLSPGDGSIAPPWEFASVSQSIAEAFDGGCFQESIANNRRTDTRLMIEPEGQSPIGESRLYLVRAKALQFVTPASVINYPDDTHGELIFSPPPSYAGTIPVSPETLQLNGVTLANTGETNADGSTWGGTLVGAPSGVRPELILAATQLQGYKDYTFNMKAEPVKLKIFANGNDLSTNTPEFCVGQRVTNTMSFEPALPAAATVQLQWLFEGDYVNRIIPASDTNHSDTYTIDSTLKTNSTSLVWWYSPGPKLVICKAAIGIGSEITTVTQHYSVSIYSPQYVGVANQQSNAVIIIPGTSVLSLGLGSGAPNDLSLQFSVQVASKMRGEMNLFQLIDTDRRYDTTPVTAKCLSSHGDFWRDNTGNMGFLVHLGLNDVESVHYFDAPSVQGLWSTVDIRDRFRVYLQFTPTDQNRATSNNIPVTLAVLKWNWEAHSQSSGGWHLVGTNYVSDISTESTNTFPEWSHVNVNNEGYTICQ
jgi:hypothetical protein